MDVSGVGYEVLVTESAYSTAPAVGEEYQLSVRLIVREDSLTLFGFSSAAERLLFDQIIAVSGIGPKTGLAILSAIGPDQLREAIRTSDIRRLTHIPGIGKKTAELLIVELRDKLVKEEFTQVASISGGSQEGNLRADAVQALVSLGYARAIAEKAIQSVLRTEPDVGRELQSLIRAALKQTG